MYDLFPSRSSNSPKKNFMRSSIIISLFFLILFHSNKQNELKQQIKVINTMKKYVKNQHYSPIVHLSLNNYGEIRGDVRGCDGENFDTGRSYFDNNVQISHCFFSRSLIYSGYGGVIYVNGGSYTMGINHSMFYNCFCTRDGGAIVFKSSNSDLRMICANRCFCGASYNYHFALCQASQLNNAEYLSISNCSHTTSGYYPICLQSGHQRVDNTNNSMNNAYQISGIAIYSPSTFISTYCTFSNNKVSRSICLFFYAELGTILVLYANIVHNNSPIQDGVIYTSGTGSRIFMNCILKNNDNFLFNLVSGSLEVFHSYIDHSPSSFSTELAVSTATNNSFTGIMTFQWQFFNSHYCNADIPLPTPLITIKQTPFESPQITIKMTNINTPCPTPYRSYGELTPHQSLFPEHTPPQTLFPVYTPFQTQNPERTNQRSFPLDFYERTPSESDIQSNNIFNENISNSIFMNSTVGLFTIIALLISYIVGCQKSKNKDYSSSSSL